MGTMAGWGKPILARERFECPYLWGQQENIPAGGSKSPFSKAAVDENTGGVASWLR
jgi:hypothetical protein